MNTLMYEHPLTSEHVRIVRDVVHYEVVGPIGKGLACGDVGAYSAFLGVGDLTVLNFQCRNRSYDRMARHCANRSGQVSTCSEVTIA